MKKTFLRLLSLALVLSFLTAPAPVVLAAGEAPAVTLSPGEVEFWVGFDAPCQLKTTVTGRPADSVLTYVSSDPAVVSVSDAGDLTPLARGTALVTARLTDRSGSTVYAVSDPVTVRVTEDPIAVPEGSDPARQLLTLGSTSRARIDTREYLTWPAAYGDAHVTLWKDGRVGVFTMTVDDNILGDYPIWNGFLADYGLPTTFIAPGKGASESAPMWNYAISLGQSVQSHSYSHPSDAGYKAMSSAEVWMDFYRSWQLVDEYTENPSLIIGYSYGVNYPEYTSKIYIGGRGTAGHSNAAATVNYNATNSFSGMGADYKSRLAEILTGGSNAGGWISVHWHNVQSSARENLNGLYAYLNELSQKREIWVGTFAQVAQYGQERDTSTLTMLSAGPDSFTFSLADCMNDNFFDFPLTVAIRVDETWERAVAVQDGTERAAEIVHRGDGTYLLVEAVPDRGRVEVRRAALEGLLDSGDVLAFSPTDATGAETPLAGTFTFPVPDTWEHAWALQGDKPLPTNICTKAGQKYVSVTCTVGGGRVILARENGSDTDRTRTATVTMDDFVSGRVTPAATQTVLVTSAEDINRLALWVNCGHDCAGVHFALTGDVDFSGQDFPYTIGCAMVGESSSSLRYYFPFSGIFDGCGYAVTGLSYEHASCGAGLFGYTDGATITRLRVSGTFGGIKWVGGIVGRMKGGSLCDCSFSGTLTNTGIDQRNSGSYTGGLVGYAEGSATVRNCEAAAVCTATAQPGTVNSGSYLGGLVGCAQTATVENCRFCGTLTAIPASDGTGASYVGGLVGGGDNDTVRDCTALADVRGRENVGGMIGRLQSAGSLAVYNCLFRGSLSAQNYVGGISGYIGPSNRAKCANCLVDVLTLTAPAEGAVVGIVFGEVNSANNAVKVDPVLYRAAAAGHEVSPLTGTKGGGAVAYAFDESHLSGTGPATLPGGTGSVSAAMNVWVAKESGYRTWSQAEGDPLPSPTHLTAPTPGFVPAADGERIHAEAFGTAMAALSAESDPMEHFAALDTAFRLLADMAPDAREAAAVSLLADLALTYNARISGIRTAAGRLKQLEALLSEPALGDLISAAAREEQ